MSGPNPDEFVRTLLAMESDYHNHKEQMSYVIATFYLVGAAFLLVATPVPFAAPPPS